MKNSGECPKCGEKDIVEIPGKVGAYGSGNNIQVGFTVFSAIKVTRYLCASCGFSEEWVTNPGDLKKVAQKFGAYRRFRGRKSSS